MASFYDLLTALEANDLEQEVKEDKVLGLIRKGLEIRKPKCGDFWEDFMALASDAEAMSDLLDVPVHKVAKWGTVIREKLAQIEDEPTGDSKNSKIVPTENEPLAHPDGVDHDFDGPADTRPMP